MMKKAEQGRMMKQAEKGMNENTLFLVLLFAYAPLLYSQTAIFKICNECNWTMAAIDCWGQNGGNTWSGAAYLAPYLGIMQDSPPGVANVS